jgi:hypothetical protein
MAGITFPLRLASSYGPKALFKITIHIYFPHPQRMGTWGKAFASHISVFLSATERAVSFHFHTRGAVIADFWHISVQCYGLRN